MLGVIPVIYNPKLLRCVGEKVIVSSCCLGVYFRNDLSVVVLMPPICVQILGVILKSYCVSLTPKKWKSRSVLRSVKSDQHIDLPEIVNLRALIIIVPDFCANKILSPSLNISSDVCADNLRT